MATSLMVLDKELTARLPIFLEVLPPSVTPQRLMRTVLMSVEKTPKLLQCSPQSIVNAATTAAVLGLECDGVTGQGFLVPYGGVATFQIGYKGFNTLAARAGYTINGGVVREQDQFDYKLGTNGFVDHKPMLTNTAGRRIIAAWAVAESTGRPAIVAVLSIDEIEAIKAKSMGARKPDSPWNDLRGPGYPAMCEKTAKRRLARSMPLSVMQQAAALEDQHDLGRAAHIMPGGDLRVVGEASVAEGPAASGTISDAQPDDILSPANKAEVAPADKIKQGVDTLIAEVKALKSDDGITAHLNGEKTTKQQTWLAANRPEEYQRLLAEVTAHRKTLDGGAHPEPIFEDDPAEGLPL